MHSEVRLVKMLIAPQAAHHIELLHARQLAVHWRVGVSKAEGIQHGQQTRALSDVKLGQGRTSQVSQALGSRQDLQGPLAIMSLAETCQRHARQGLHK